MSPPTIQKVLHVEDEPVQQLLIGHYLKALKEFTFQVTSAESEDLAMEAFRAGEFDLVLVDYQLSEGDGLHLLRRLRQFDPVVPIIVVSGTATSEIVADLVQAGADDCFDKRDLTSATLARSLRTALLRAETVRKRKQDSTRGGRCQVDQRLLELCQYFTLQVGAELIQRLDILECETREAQLRPTDLEELYGSVCSRLEVAGGPSSVSVRLLLRPLMLEWFFRVHGDGAEPALEEGARAIQILNWCRQEQETYCSTSTEERGILLPSGVPRRDMIA